MVDPIETEPDVSRRTRLGRRLRFIAVVLAFAPAFATLVAVAARRMIADVSAELPAALEPLAPADVGSALVLARLGGRAVALVADPDRSEILTFDLAAGCVAGRTPVPGGPSALVLARDGELYVTLREAAKVAVFRAAARGLAVPLLKVAEIATPVEPTGLALGPDDATLAVVSGWSHAFTAFSTKSGARIASADLDREPRAVAIDGSGKRAIVAHAVGSRLSVVDLESGRVDGEKLEGVEKETPVHVRGPGPAAAERRRAVDQGFAIARLDVGEGERFFVPEVLVDSGDPTLAPVASNYGGVASDAPAILPALVIFDATDGLVRESMRFPSGFEVRRAALLDQPPDRRPCLLPRGAAVDRTKRSVFVACVGSDQVIEYDVGADKLASETARWNVPAGPTAVVAWPRRDRLVVWSAFDRVLTIADRAATDSFVAISAEPARVQTPFEVGRKLFHRNGDNRIARDGRACASCHPDARDDGLTWTGPEGARQTPMLAGRLADTAPYGWSGTSSTVDDHIRQTMVRLSGFGLDDQARYALVTYLEEVKPPPNVAPRAPGLVARGAIVFASAETGCASCHVPGYGFTDGLSHDVRSLQRRDRTAKLDTPSLRFLGGTAPYFHDGRYENLRQLLAATDGTMGSTGHLQPDDRDALIAYLESL